MLYLKDFLNLLKYLAYNNIRSISGWLNIFLKALLQEREREKKKKKKGENYLKAYMDILSCVRSLLLYRNFVCDFFINILIIM